MHAYQLYSVSLFFALIASLVLAPTCYARAAVPTASNNLENYNTGQNGNPVDIKFPMESSDQSQNQPIATDTERDLEISELLKDLPANIDLKNLTPEQKEALDDLVSLAEQEDSQVQGRTFGLVKHKFNYLWNKFISLFGPKFIEFEHIPNKPFVHGEGEYINNRLHKPGYGSAWMPSLFGGITRFFADTGNGNSYGAPAYTHEEIFE